MSAPRRPRVPGLSDEWAKHQLDLLELQRKLCDGMGVPVEQVNPSGTAPWSDPSHDPVADLEAAVAAIHAAPYEPSGPCCRSCTVVPGYEGPGTAWDCDPDRPGCPLHDVPEVTRDRAPCPGCGGVMDMTRRVWFLPGARFACSEPCARKATQ